MKLKAFFRNVKEISFAFIILCLWIFLGILIPRIPQFLMPLKLGSIVLWMLQYLVTPVITCIIAYRVYRQWQYDKFTELNDRVIRAESLYVEKMERYYQYLNGELTDCVFLSDTDKQHYIIEYLGELEFFALSVLKYKVVGYDEAKEHLQYIILACFDSEQQKDLAEYLRKTKENNNRGYYKYLYKLYDLYKTL